MDDEHNILNSNEHTDVGDQDVQETDDTDREHHCLDSLTRDKIRQARKIKTKNDKQMAKDDSSSANNNNAK